MKKLLIIALLASSVGAYAQTTKQYANDAVELLIATTQCPNEMKALSKLGRIASASHTVLNDVDLYAVHFVAGGYAPTFQSYLVGTLVVSASYQAKSALIPDRARGKTYTCQINK